MWDITYTVPRPNASKQERKRIREVTEEQIQRTNANTAQRKLEQLMACNFDENDLVLTVTYRVGPAGQRRRDTQAPRQSVLTNAGLPQSTRLARAEIHLYFGGPTR